MPLALRYSIWKVLSYFDLFDYPVSQDEIGSYLDQPVTRESLSDALAGMQREGQIFRCGSYFSIRPDDGLVMRRIAGNHRAQPLLRTGRRIAGFLYQVPFVRAIGISGSLSKNFAAEDADIDYFIITRADRLWLARTIMHLVKKLSFLLGRQHWYCMNYYIDEAGLEIEEKNIYTAMELVTLVPVCGDRVLAEFFRKNDWTNAFYPNCRPGPAGAVFPPRASWLKRGCESLLAGGLGSWLDDRLMRVTARRWKRKEALGKCSAKGNPMGLHTGKHFSRPNPLFLQKNILDRFSENLRRFNPGACFPAVSSSSSVRG